MLLTLMLCCNHMTNDSTFICYTRKTTYLFKLVIICNYTYEKAVLTGLLIAADNAAVKQYSTEILFIYNQFCTSDYKTLIANYYILQLFF